MFLFCRISERKIWITWDQISLLCSEAATALTCGSWSGWTPWPCSAGPCCARPFAPWLSLQKLDARELRRLQVRCETPGTLSNTGQLLSAWWQNRFTAKPYCPRVVLLWYYLCKWLNVHAPKTLSLFYWRQFRRAPPISAPFPAGLAKFEAIFVKAGQNISSSSARSSLVLIFSELPEVSNEYSGLNTNSEKLFWAAAVCCLAVGSLRNKVL